MNHSESVTKKGNAIKVDFNINKVGTTIFVRPRDYEQFCAALGRANGKTEEEAEMLGDIFSRGFVLNSKTGKLELWPLPYAPDDSWPEDESGNRYLVDSDDAQNLLIRKINCDKRSLETVPVMNLRDSGLRLTDYNFQVLKGYILLNIEDYADRRNKTLVVKPDGQTRNCRLQTLSTTRYTLSRLMKLQRLLLCFRYAVSKTICSLKNPSLLLMDIMKTSGRWPTIRYERL